MKNNIPFRDIFRNQNKGTLLVSATIAVFFAVVITSYNVLLLNSVSSNMVSTGQISAERSAKTVDMFLSDCYNSLTVVEYTLNDLIADGASDEEILEFITQHDASLKHTIGSETAKLYSLIDGRIFDGEEEAIRVPDYDPSERPWYRKAAADREDFVLVDPYKDVHTGNILMTISKAMNGEDNFVMFDVSLEHIQQVIEQQSSSSSSLTEMVLDSTLSVVAHSDTNELGRSYTGEDPDTVGAVIASMLPDNKEQYFDLSFGGHRYTAYIVPILGDWVSVSAVATSDEYMPIRILFMVSIAVSAILVLTVIFILIRTGRKELLAARLNSQLSSAADIYLSLSDIDLINNTVIQIKDFNPRFLTQFTPDTNNVQETFNRIMESMPDTPTKQAAIDFVDLSTIADRLAEKGSVLLEYQSHGYKWVRARFVESERTPDRKLSHVLWMLEDIDAEKKERDRLTAKADKLMNQLSSAADIYISLCDLDVPNNTATAIKNANPAIAAAVEAGKDNMQETFFGIMRGLPESPTKQAAIDFCDLSKIDEKLSDTNTITVEYLSYGNIWVRGRYVVSERDGNGKVKHVLWMLENIDAEKKERDRLSAKADKLMNQLSSAADIYISLCDLDVPNNTATAIKNANPAIAAAVEAGKDNMQETFFGIMRGLPESPTKQAAIDFCDLSKIDEKLSDTNTITVEYLSYGNIWVRGRYVVSERDGNGKVKHVLWMLENIDAEKKERDRLSAVADKLNNQMSSIASIYMSAYDFDLTNDTFSEVRATNSRVIDLIGQNYSNAQHMLLKVMDSIIDKSAEAAVHEFMDLSTLDVRLKDTRTITIEYLSNEKTWRRARFIASERSQDGKLRHVLLVAEDIDKEKKDREKLIDISERAVAANEAKSSFLSNMSHEIRTPINAVLGMNEMILRECSDPAVISYSESIRTAGNTLLGLINDILDFSKIEAGKMEIIPVDYDLATVLSDLVNMIQTRLDNKGLMLITDFDSKMPHLLHGDEVRIKQIITNILTNAAKYTEKGNVTFSVTYEKAADDPDFIDMKVAVRDTGIGIKQEDMAKLFSKFERIEEERNRTIEGTGLGMSITQSLLSMMNSRLEVSSVYGEGSVFGFTLRQRVRKWDELGNYEEAHKNSISSRKKYHEKFTAPDAHILVVDDTVMNLLVFTSLLKSTKVKIDTAESGDDGILLALRNKYDIIFLDHMMPQKDGIETLHEIRAAESCPNRDTPMICLTANAISGAREKYIEAGFNDYLTKPIESAKLEEMICEYLPPEKLRATASVKPKAPPRSVIPDAVFNIIELDAVAGINNAGSEEMYLELLRAYSDMMTGHLDKLTDYWLAGDIANTAVMLHSLKGASRTVGAEQIRRAARKLENAGMNGDADTLNNELEDLLFRCRALGAQIASVIGQIPAVSDIITEEKNQ